MDLGEGVDPIVLTPVLPTSSAGVRSRGNPPKGEHRRGARYTCWPSWTTTPLGSSARQQPHRGRFRAHRSPQPLWQEPASFMCDPWKDVSINCQLRVRWPHWRSFCDSTFHVRRPTPRLSYCCQRSTCLCPRDLLSTTHAGFLWLTEHMCSSKMRHPTNPVSRQIPSVPPSENNLLRCSPKKGGRPLRAGCP